MVWLSGCCVNRKGSFWCGVLIQPWKWLNLGILLWGVHNYLKSSCFTTQYLLGFFGFGPQLGIFQIKKYTINREWNEADLLDPLLTRSIMSWSYFGIFENILDRMLSWIYTKGIVWLFKVVNWQVARMGKSVTNTAPLSIVINVNIVLNVNWQEFTQRDQQNKY